MFKRQKVFDRQYSFPCREFADEVLASAENVIRALEEAELAQNSADEAVKAANDAIEDTKKDLVQVK